MEAIALALAVAVYSLWDALEVEVRVSVAMALAVAVYALWDALEVKVWVSVAEAVAEAVELILILSGKRR